MSRGLLGAPSVDSIGNIRTSMYSGCLCHVAPFQCSFSRIVVALQSTRERLLPHVKPFFKTFANLIGQSDLLLNLIGRNLRDRLESSRGSVACHTANLKDSIPLIALRGLEIRPLSS